MQAPLAEAIKKAGSQTKLAKMLGLHRSNITQWIRRKKVPSTHAIAIERMFQIPANSFNNPFL